jgi:hypothetical protein
MQLKNTSRVWRNELGEREFYNNKEVGFTPVHALLESRFKMMMMSKLNNCKIGM